MRPIAASVTACPDFANLGAPLNRMRFQGWRCRLDCVNVTNLAKGVA